MKRNAERFFTFGQVERYRDDGYGEFVKLILRSQGRYNVNFTDKTDILCLAPRGVKRALQHGRRTAMLQGTVISNFLDRGFRRKWTQEEEAVHVDLCVGALRAWPIDTCSKQGRGLK